MIVRREATIFFFLGHQSFYIILGQSIKEIEDLLKKESKLINYSFRPIHVISVDLAWCLRTKAGLLKLMI